MRYDIAIQRIMKQAGITQAELARRIEMTPANVSQIVNGVHAPSAGTLAAIGKALDVPPELIALFGAEPGELKIASSVAAELAKHLLAVLLAKPGRKKGRAS